MTRRPSRVGERCGNCPVEEAVCPYMLWTSGCPARHAEGDQLAWHRAAVLRMLAFEGPTPPLDARLIDPGLKRIVASRRFEIRQPVRGKEVPQVVETFGTASDALSAQLVNWVIGHATAGKWNQYGG